MRPRSALWATVAKFECVHIKIESENILDYRLKKIMELFDKHVIVYETTIM